MLKKIVLLGLMVTLGAALAAPLFAAESINGAVSVPASDAPNFTGSAACRVWSTTDLGINLNQAATFPTCVNNRCTRPYNAAKSIYNCNQENTVAYGADAEGETFYELIDSDTNGAACNHAAFFAAQGSIPKAAGATGGDNRVSGCPAGLSGNCLELADGPDARPTPLVNVNSGYGSNLHAIPSVGGFSPVPTVRVAFPGTGCAAGSARLTWDEPESYTTAMKDGVSSPVKGVHIYSNSSPCSSCPNSSTGWVSVANGLQNTGAGAAGICVPVTGQSWYAMTVRLKGPASATSDPNGEVETGVVGQTRFVGANSQCVTQDATAVRIANMTARYSGRGSVAVSFTTGIEGGVQGYYVTRSASPNGSFTRVSQQLSPRGDGSSYQVTDKVRSALGRVLYYSVDVVTADGTIEHSGPVAVTLPAAKRKLGSN